MSVEGNYIDSATSMSGLHQVILGPKHTLSQSSSCIDLIFTDHLQLIPDCGIHALLHPNCQHQITYCQLNLKITYPPPYKRLVLDYKKVNSICIKKALQTVINWDVLFHLRSIHEQVNVFNYVDINFGT